MTQDSAKDQNDVVYILMHENFWMNGERGELFEYRKECPDKNTNEPNITILISDRLVKDGRNNGRITKGTWTSDLSEFEKNIVEHQLSNEYILNLNSKNSAAYLYKFKSDEYYKVESVHIIPFETDFNKRIRGIFDVKLIKDKTVALVGVGSMGSQIALDLVKSGIQKFILIDPDILEVHNICRHMCGLSDIGRSKVDAVKDLILDKNPNSEIVVIKESFTIFKDHLCNNLCSADIIIVSTDVDVAKRDINELCVKNEIPAIYTGAFERAFGGEVVRYIPGVTACYNCVLGYKRMIEEEIPSGNVLVDYSAIDDPNKVVAEPGLSIDMGFVSLITTKVCLETLKGNWILNGNDPDEPPEIIFWGNKQDWIFKGPFDYVPAKCELGPRSCKVCDPEFFNKKWGKSNDEIHKELRESYGELLDNIRKNNNDETVGKVIKPTF